MRSRVVGQMESSRGRGRRAGRGAASWLAAAWKAGPVNGSEPEPDTPVTPVTPAADTPERALVSEPGPPGDSAERNRVPAWLQTGAAWSWRLLLLAAALYLVARVIGILAIVVVPCTAALLLTALLQPLKGRLRRAGLP